MSYDHNCTVSDCARDMLYEDAWDCESCPMQGACESCFNEHDCSNYKDENNGEF